MKKFAISFILLFLWFTHVLLSQNYFGTTTDVPVYNSANSFSTNIYFGLGQISTQFLDISVTQLLDNYRTTQWNPNNGGNGSFGDYIQFPSQPSGSYVANLFLKLRPDATSNDLVICRTDGLEVHYNDNGISGVQQNIPCTFGSTFGPQFEPGIFDSQDNYQDIIVSDGSNTIQIFRNLMSQNPPNLQQMPSITFNNTPTPHVYNFKLKQLTQKEEGYIQNDPNDKADIVFVDKSNPLGTQVYAYQNNNADGFNTTPGSEFANFTTDIPVVSDLGVADFVGNGLNDLILIGVGGTCPYAQFYVRIYRNVQGVFFSSTPQWSYTSNQGAVGCGARPKICIADLNKDGLNDFVCLIQQANGNIFSWVFINQGYGNFGSGPVETANIPESDGVGAYYQFSAGDIYGSQSQDGGGIALLLSYSTSANGTSDIQHIKVLNADQGRQHSVPPPPICQGLLEFGNDNQWHPHLHLNNRGERDFQNYIVHKTRIDGFDQDIWSGSDTGFTDYQEVVNLGSRPIVFYNCYYYAKEVDFANNNSIPSPKVGYLVNLPSGGTGNGVFHFPDTSSNKVKIPDKFSVLNYPNPFNPSTKLSYALPKPAKVVIKVFDILGRMVKELVNENKDAGFYNVIFDGTNYASGIYFYRIEAVEFNGTSFGKTGRMLLIK